MNVKTMAITAALLAMALQAAMADSWVGYNKITVPAGTDVRFSLPFNQPVQGTFSVNTKTGAGVTVTNTLTAGQYANSYYVRFITGNASGLWSTVTGNTAGEIDLADANILALVNPGDQFRVYPHQTLSKVFPQGLFGVSFTTGSQILFFDNNLAAMAQNKSASKVALYTSGHWVGSGINNNTIMPPETQFIFRNNSGASLTMFTFGGVADYSVSHLIAPNGDLLIGTGYPVPVVLNNGGLNGNSRQVLFYSNSATGENKSASKVALYSSGSGKWLGAGITGNELINGSDSLTLRLPSTETGAEVTINKPY